MPWEISEFFFGVFPKIILREILGNSKNIEVELKCESQNILVMCTRFDFSYYISFSSLAYNPYVLTFAHRYTTYLQLVWKLACYHACEAYTDMTIDDGFYIQ